MLPFVRLLGGLFLGFSLGQNGCPKALGPAVSAQMVPYRTACLLGAVMAFFGAVVGGGAGVGETLVGLAPQTLDSAFVVSLSAAFSKGVTNTLARNVRLVNFSAVYRIVFGWVVTPLLGGAIAYGLAILLLAPRGFM